MPIRLKFFVLGGGVGVCFFFFFLKGGVDVPILFPRNFEGFGGERYPCFSLVFGVVDPIQDMAIVVDPRKIITRETYKHMRNLLLKYMEGGDKTSQYNQIIHNTYSIRGKFRPANRYHQGSFAFLQNCIGVWLSRPRGYDLNSEEDKRATTNVQNGLVFFFLFSFILFYYL